MPSILLFPDHPFQKFLLLILIQLPGLDGGLIELNNPGKSKNLHDPDGPGGRPGRLTLRNQQTKLLRISLSLINKIRNEVNIHNDG
jgi:hypothetical protein